MEVDSGNLEAHPLSLIFSITSILVWYARIGIPSQNLITKIVMLKTMYCPC